MKTSRIYHVAAGDYDIIMPFRSSKSTAIASFVLISLVLSGLYWYWPVSKPPTGPTQESPEAEDHQSDKAEPQHFTAVSESDLLSALRSSYNGTIRDDQIIWHPSEAAIDQWENLGACVSKGKPAATDILGTAISPTQKGMLYVLIRTHSTEPESHACGALVGGAVLVSENGQWVVASLRTHIGSFSHGTFGTLPTPTVIDLGEKRVGFQMTVKDTYQGYTRGSIAIFAHVKGEMREVLHIRDAFFDNDGARTPGEPRAHYRTELEAVPSTKAFYDIRAIRSGTVLSADPKTAERADKVTIYAFNGTTYTALPGA